MNVKEVRDTETLDYTMLVKKYPWIVKRGQDCIISPDSDGLLCGLLMTNYFGWRVRGFYDGKILLIAQEYKPKDCVFLDMEIFRKNVRSVGQHMVMFNRNKLPPGWENFENCISANNLRDYDVNHNFSQKYPLGTIHLLLSIAGLEKEIDITTDAICPLLYTDGTFKNLFNYPDNCLGWLRYLQAEKKTSPLHKIFFNDHYTISSLMLALEEFFSELRIVAHGKRGADKIRFSDSKGKLINFDRNKGTLSQSTRQQAEQFLELLAEKVDWAYKPEHWSWTKLRAVFFKKGNIVPGLARYQDLMKKKPISLAVISGRSIEYTLDPSNAF